MPTYVFALEADEGDHDTYSAWTIGIFSTAFKAMEWFDASKDQDKRRPYLFAVEKPMSDYATQAGRNRRYYITRYTLDVVEEEDTTP